MIYDITEAPGHTYTYLSTVFSMTRAKEFLFLSLTTLSSFLPFSITGMQMHPNPIPHPGSAHLVLFDVLLDSL